MEMVPDALTEELEAMAAIGRVLGNVPDSGTRQRVLKWAVERFAADLQHAPNLIPATAPVSETSPASDPALTIDSLDDMFTNEPEGTPDDLVLPQLEPPAPAVAVQKLPLEAV